MTEMNYYLLGYDTHRNPPSFLHLTRAITIKLKDDSHSFKASLLTETSFPPAVAIFQLGVNS